MAEPETVLAACDVVIKPTREDNPWGRDILEGLASGKPVISVGTYDRFVETGKTGFLLEQYDAERVADILLELDRDRSMIGRLSSGARERMILLCDGPARANDLANLWEVCDHVTGRTTRAVDD